MAITIDRLAESFVKRPIKFKGTKSSGEGKLYIAAKGDKQRIDTFFNSFATGNKYKFDRENFLEYLFSVKFEYEYNIFNSYNEADLSYWEDAVKTIRQLKDSDFYFDARLFDDGARLYVENPARDDIFYKFFREYALPVITKVEIDYQAATPNVFVFKLFLKDNLKEPQPDNLFGAIDGFNHNRIIYGAPGTGKSHKVEADSLLFGINKTRVTFYPDYSYAKFVGSYKPFTYYKSNVGTSSVKSLYFDSKTDVNQNTEIVNEPVIDYVFTPGPFIQALIKAYKSAEPYLLLIEEINRANAAAVFGEIFQLLDRKKGKSAYSVTLSHEAMIYLQNELSNTKIDISAGIYLPDNLYIWCTMNSADQGVYHMDAAFKRRWSFEYVPLNENEGQCAEADIAFSNKRYNWNLFRKAINAFLISKKISEDRLLGPFFMNESELSDDNSIKNKLLLYLRDDVLRHNHRQFFKYDTFNEIIEHYNDDAGIVSAEIQKILDEIVD